MRGDRDRRRTIDGRDGPRGLHGPRGGAPVGVGLALIALAWIFGSGLVHAMPARVNATQESPEPPRPLPDSPPPRAPVPATVLLAEDFEVGELEDPRQTVIFDNWPRYLIAEWSQFFGPGYPKSMSTGLARGGAPDPGSTANSGRYLRLLLRGGDALIEGPELTLEPHSLVRITVDLRWRGLGSGRVHIGVRTGSEARRSLLTLSGEDRDWSRSTRSIEIPADSSRARVELWVEGDPLEFDGELGFDNLRIEVLPRVLLSWHGSLRRIQPQDDRPINVKSVGFPEGEYHLDFIVENPEGEEIFRESMPRFVTDALPLDFDPRLRWFQHSVGRGLYTVRLVLRSETGWELRDSREFALAGKPPFEPLGGSERWGLILSATERPPWLPIFERERFVHALPERSGDGPVELASLPDWFREQGEFRRGLLIDASAGWEAADVPRFEPLFGHVHEWYWSGDATAGTAFHDALLGAASYLRVGLRAESGGRTVPVGTLLYPVPADELADPSRLAALDFGGREWCAELDPRQFSGERQERALATALYLLAAGAPRTVFLSAPGPFLFSRAGKGGWVPTRTYLAWEFTTAFLSGAEFVRLEEWDPRGVCAIFERDGEEFLMVVSSGEDHTLRLAAGSGRAFDSIGAERRLEAVNGIDVEIPVTSEPLLIQGLDLARVRTLRSLEASGGKISRGGVRETILVRFKNHFARPVHARLSLTPPDEWTPIPSGAVQAVAAGADGEWTLEVEVPLWYGIEDDAEFDGTLDLDFGDGRTESLPVEVPIPFESSLIAIEPVRIAADGAEVRVRNISQRTLDLVIYLAVQAAPQDREAFEERKHDGQRLAPGDERIYTFDYRERPEARRLLVGVVIETLRSHVNRSFDVPGR